MSSLALFFLRGKIKEVHLKKDVGLFPLYLRKEYFDSAEIIKIGTKDDTPLTLGDIKFTNLFFEERVDNDLFTHSKKFELKCIFKSFFYLLKHKNITHIMIFNVTRFSLGLSFLVKVFMPKRKIYLKLDANTDVAKQLAELPENFKERFFYKLIAFSDMISIETSQNYEILSKNPYFSKKLQLVPNGFETSSASTANPKEDIIISVARFGSYPKNTELLLSVFANLKLNDWKIYLLGPIEKDEQDFELFIRDFFEKHPHLKEKIIFTGNINDQKILNNYYEKAKVFVLPSRFESFGIATLEAASYGDFLILTDVGCARDIILDDDFGIILPNSTTSEQTDDSLSKSMSETLQKIIDGQIKADSNLEERKKVIYDKFSMKNIVKSEACKNWAKTFSL